MAITTTDIRYPDISSKAYEHPADRAATAALGAIPMLERVLKRLYEAEPGSSAHLRAAAARGRGPALGAPAPRGARRPPRRAACTRHPKTAPKLYLKQSPRRGGRTRTMELRAPVVILSSGVVLASSTPGPLSAVLGHEAGHILSDHVHYATVLAILQQLLRTGHRADRPPSAPGGDPRPARVVPAAPRLSCDPAPRPSSSRTRRSPAGCSWTLAGGGSGPGLDLQRLHRPGRGLSRRRRPCCPARGAG